MADPVTRTNPEVLTYRELRKAVGLIAFFLPFALVTGNILLTQLGTGAWPHPRLQDSVSMYFYTNTGHFFTGALCAIAMFLMCCRGYDRQDEITGYVACALTLAVAFFPTTPEGPATSLQDALGWVHEISAAVLFLVLSYFCFFLFTKSGGNPTRRKLQRNTLYRVCGSIIVLSIGIMVLLQIPALKAVFQNTIVILIFETVCLLAFGVAWLTKGETILKDEGGSQNGSPAATPPNEAQRTVTV